MKHKLIIFDLDGTLADTSDGILNCHRFANREMGKPVSDEQLSGIIGGPLLQNYREHFGYSEEDALKAVSIYRKRYSEIGFKEATLYEGMKQTLAQLKGRGYKLAVATLKAERFAIPILEGLGVAEYFDLIHGVDDSDTRTKASLIEMCINELSETKDSSVLVGDSHHDALGAQEAGIDFVAALYGFGFKNAIDADKYSHVATILSPSVLLDLFSTLNDTQ